MNNAGASAGLGSGKSFADLSSWRKIAVVGTEALTWLSKLTSDEVAELAPGRARPATVLASPQEQDIEFTIAVAGANVLLIQDPVQARSPGELLAPHIGSADVALDDRSGDLALFAFPGRAVAPNAPGTAFCAPSCLGTGIDLIGLMEDHDFLLASLSKAFTPVRKEDLELWRVAAGSRPSG